MKGFERAFAVRFGVPYARAVTSGMVLTDVPPHGLVHGVPARLRGYTCVCGASLASIEKRTFRCAWCGRRYTLAATSRGLTACSRD